MSSNILIFYERRDSINNITLLGVECGVVYCNLENIMKKENISIYKLSKLTGLKYDVILRYYNNTVTRYDSFVLAKLCFTLDCSISDLLKYEV